MDKLNKTREQQRRDAIDALIARVRALPAIDKMTLARMLENEVDLPYLDSMEREYSSIYRTLAPDRAVALRGRFLQTLTQSREQLLTEIWKVLHEDCGGYQPSNA